jgi:putative sugar O-methyltransferase
MLLLRRGFSYAIGDRGAEADMQVHRADARARWDVMRRVVPDAYFGSFEESAVGSPVAFEFDEHTLSAAGIVNALTSHRVIEACARVGLNGRPLRILEIGAGYGGVADQLLQRLDVSLYAVCDLPENGFLSAFYLQANHPDRESLFLGTDEAPTGPQPGLVFAVPDQLDQLPGEFDVIVNSYSFQEMTATSVAVYLDFAARRLSTDGLLYSLNSHAKAGVQRPSQYEVERFSVDKLACPRPFPWQLNGTVPYELVLRRRSTPPLEGDALTRRRVQFDGLGGAMQLGLNDELAPLIDTFVTRDEGAPDRGLDALSAAFGQDPAQRRTAAHDVSGAVGAHVSGIHAFIMRDDEAARRELASALDGLSDGHARVWALTVLAALDSVNGDHRRSMSRARAAVAVAPHLAADVARLVGEPETARAMLASLAGRADRTPQAPASNTNPLSVE